ncbi:MAG: ParB/RepB/Spo0J family partition protein [Clostridiales bacterium]|nr:ParB/RepB/Spo0J family partition protein [Candidatus Crickella caballi]
MAKKAGLGRGLDALFADAAPINEEDYSAGTAEQIAEKAEPAKSEEPAKLAKPKAKTTEKKSKTDKAAASEKTEKTAEKTINKKDADKNADSDSEDVIIYADINDIKPNAAQPRKKFDEDKIKELAESIKANGVIQPLIVRPSENGYELVAGERRWRASRIAGLKKVPCIIRHFDDRQNAIVAIIENMQRENLDPIEEAEGLKSMTEKYGFTQEQVSASLGKSRAYITNSIRLLKLPEEIREYVSNGQMSAAHGRTIINVDDVKKQKEICEKVIKEGLSVRATERLAEKAKDEIKPNRKKRAGKVKKSQDILAAEAELRTLTGTKVNISGDGKTGKLEFDYYSTEELNRLIDTVKDAFK